MKLLIFIQLLFISFIAQSQAVFPEYETIERSLENEKLSGSLLEKTQTIKLKINSDNSRQLVDLVNYDGIFEIAKK